jgi:hypothetical protein
LFFALHGGFDLGQNEGLILNFPLEDIYVLSECLFFIIEHLEEALLLQLALDVGHLRHVSAILDEDIEARGAIPFLRELELLVILVVCAVGNEHLDYLH